MRNSSFAMHAIRDPLADKTKCGNIKLYNFISHETRRKYACAPRINYYFLFFCVRIHVFSPLFFSVYALCLMKISISLMIFVPWHAACVRVCCVCAAFRSHLVPINYNSFVYRISPFSAIYVVDGCFAFATDETNTGSKASTASAH